MRKMRIVSTVPACLATISLFMFSACTPRVELETPDKPITINLNVKIDHEIRVKVDKELDQVLSTNNGLF